MRLPNRPTNTGKRRARPSALAAALTTAALPALAAPSQQAPMQMEEVIVTAQKREESLREVPISAAVLDRDALEVRGIGGLADIGPSVPNLYMNPFNVDPTAVRLFIRGIGQNDIQITQDPSVALYLDGVYVGTSFGSGFDGVDIERVEVLRGPQGTLYGRNATGGAINIVSKRADVDAFSARQDLVSGNLGKFLSRTVVNVPVTDRLAVKLNYLNNRRDGYVDNHGIGEDFGQLDRHSTVLDVRLEASDEFTIDYRYEDAKLRDTQRFDQVTRFGDGALAGLTQYMPPLASTDRLDDTASLRDIAKNDQRVRAHNLWLDWQPNDALTLRSITSRRRLDSDTSSDNLSTALGLYSFLPSNPITNEPTGADGAPSIAVFETDFEQTTQEFQLLGDLAHWQFIAGLYYYEDEAAQDASASTRVGLSDRTDLTETENRSIATYGQATWNPAFMAQRWHFTLGARMTWDRRRAERVNLSTFPPVIGDYDESFKNFNPALTVAYDATDTLNVYASVVTGYKSGGTSNRSANAALFAEGFGEEEVVNYEIGAKSELWSGRARLSAALFYTTIDGLQTSVQTDPYNPGGRDFLPVDDNTIRGGELDLSLLLAEGLSFSLGYGYLDTRLGEHSVSAGGVTTALSDVMPYAPEQSVSAALDYIRPMAIGAVGFNLNYAWQDEASTSPNIDDETVIDSYGLLGGALFWTDIAVGNMPGSFRLMLWGKNLTDEEYGLVSTAAWSTFGAAEVQTFGDPRTYGATLSYQY